MAGGFNSVADRSRMSIERLSERSEKRIVEVTLPAQAKSSVVNGDVLRVFSSVNTAIPQYKHTSASPSKAKSPSRASTCCAAVRHADRRHPAAGGLTPHAYVYGTDFSRESVRVSQQENYDRALRDMETELTKYSSTQRATTADEATANAQRVAGTERLLESNASQLPDLTVEDGDRLLIPNRPMTVGVFGSVFQRRELPAEGRRDGRRHPEAGGRPDAGRGLRRDLRDPRERHGRELATVEQWLAGLRQQSDWPASASRRYGLRAGRDEQDHVHPGSEGLDADLVSVRPGRRGSQDHQELIMANTISSPAQVDGEGDVLATLSELATSWRLLIGGTLLVSALAAGVSMVLPAVYTAQTVLLPPQPPSSLASAQLGSLATLGRLRV
ncbi:hypothetical protein Ddc_19703 [Ditylenchus destructor]|nr:hypothetical protein Ddc_19703 [Ditylenchus destructor]